MCNINGLSGTFYFWNSIWCPQNSQQCSRTHSNRIFPDLTPVLYYSTILQMKQRHKRTLELIFARPSSGNIRWDDSVSLFRELGAEIKEREGSRVEVFLFGQVRVYHRPHPRPDTDKGAVANVRRWLEQNGITP